MIQSILQRLKEYFSNKQSDRSYFSEYEKKLLKQGVKRANAEASAVADTRGYKLHPKIAQLKIQVKNRSESNVIDC